MSPTRKATHAGSWYSSSGELGINLELVGAGLQPACAASKLEKELSGWLGAVGPTDELPLEFPVKGCKAIIAPCVYRRNLAGRWS